LLSMLMLTQDPNLRAWFVQAGKQRCNNQFSWCKCRCSRGIAQYPQYAVARKERRNHWAPLDCGISHVSCVFSTKTHRGGLLRWLITSGRLGKRN
jgi:hypothetical protein